jgi:menaquinol-cytochrome c reductase iron-sulfur subunit
MTSPRSESVPDPDEGRRDFLRQASAVVIGGIVTAIPIAAGLPVILDPLRRPSQAGQPIKVTTLDALPSDGLPRKFSIISSRSDAWTRYESVPIGAVYLRRLAGDQVEALNVVCPHAGCFVDYQPSKSAFFCPCHNSRFAQDGTIADKDSPSPRGMDRLEVELRDGKEVWVRFQNFRSGQAKQEPLA